MNSRDPVQHAINVFNFNPSYDGIDGRNVAHRARRPILATDCDYEVVSFSGVQGRRVAR